MNKEIRLFADAELQKTLSGVSLAVAHQRWNRVSLSTCCISSASFCMTSENVMADVEALSVTMMDKPLVQFAIEESFSYRLAAKDGRNCFVSWRSRPIPPLSGDLLRSSSAAAAALMAPASTRDTIRKRVGVLLEAGVNRWDICASKALNNFGIYDFKWIVTPISEIWKKFTSLEQRSKNFAFDDPLKIIPT